MRKKVDHAIGDRIKVVCRLRPFLPNESTEKAVQIDNQSVILQNKGDVGNPMIFKNFTSCYDAQTTQETIFDQDVRPLIDRVFEGYDATIFCYGVTGSGKTYTMEGCKNQPGIIPRVAQFLFETKVATKISTIDITMSYMEILKESVFDMLAGRAKSASLDIREDANRDVFVANLTEKPIHSYEDFEKLFHAACKRRSTANTKLNTRSSRSHAILCLKVTTSTPIDADHQETITGKIHLIDLAGSEDNRKSGNGKARMTESAAINKSLFILGQVVQALNNGSVRVPFRDSKMTRILQPTLVGKALGMMIVNIAPGYNYITDTFNTLNFACRSKEIKSMAKAKVLRSRVTRTSSTPVSLPVKTKANNAYPSPPSTNRDKGMVTSTKRPLASLYQAHNYDTYEQQLRKQHRVLASVSAAPPISMLPTPLVRQWYEEIPPPSSSLHQQGDDAIMASPPSSSQRSSQSAVPDRWSTITAQTEQLHTVALNPMQDNGEELIVMTKAELDALRQKWISQGRNEWKSLHLSSP
ncbi:kinesin-domain-containing protein [Hesseltinella vesiculosa]|uniref:Kinesin-like protein n=1 Tax=Hesseltinella vesiculosa TaxID=101127 RepID=A0A1X2G9Z0_9FUNG|nr:kinesin-domain-containing protein [Hesseltinella vesiculosa]